MQKELSEMAVQLCEKQTYSSYWALYRNRVPKTKYSVLFSEIKNKIFTLSVTLTRSLYDKFYYSFRLAANFCLIIGFTKMLQMTMYSKLCKKLKNGRTYFYFAKRSHM